MADSHLSNNLACQRKTFSLRSLSQTVIDALILSLALATQSKYYQCCDINPKGPFWGT